MARTPGSIVEFPPHPVITTEANIHLRIGPPDCLTKAALIRPPPDAKPIYQKRGLLPIIGVRANQSCCPGTAFGSRHQ